MILDHDLLTNPRTAHLLAALPRTQRIVDVGCGIRPCPVFPADEYVCIEPHQEYIDHLADFHPFGMDIVTRLNMTALEGLIDQPRADTTVLLLDVIEHMERRAGERTRDLLMEFDHAVVFTPLGWYEQGEETPDCWGLNGGYWQKHRSAWQPEDFPGWTIHKWRPWHPKNGVGAILAVR